MTHPANNPGRTGNGRPREHAREDPRDTCRNALKPLLGAGIENVCKRAPHPGLLLAKGLIELPEDNTGTSKAGELKSQLIDRVAGLKPSRLYLAAYQRWRQATEDSNRFAGFVAEFVGRLYVGTVRDNPLETGVTTAHAYGMPLIPGSSVKGLCRACACAGEWIENEEARSWMFGAESDAKSGAEAGGLIFHDAWWVPTEKFKPFAAEVITVHHPGYYQNGSANGEGRADAAPILATDFDSPIPAPQIAVRGSFYFCIEGDPDWAKAAANLLRKGLEQRGIGGKRSSGYGFTTATSQSPPA